MYMYIHALFNMSYLVAKMQCMMMLIGEGSSSCMDRSSGEDILGVGSIKWPTTSSSLCDLHHTLL